MKVFISHSSQDRWIARRLSQDLEGRGVTTFLDEKDVLTGDSIDDSIQQNLADCDEVLMLLSPAALESHWVLLEIGGAKALGKKLVPILLHVGPNDLPPPLGKGLARDLNDVEKYYEELDKRGKTPTPRKRTPRKDAPTRKDARTTTPRAQAASVRRRTFSVGDLVKIPEQRQPTFHTDKYQVRWNPEMDAHKGKTATVTKVDTDRTVVLDLSDWWWAMDWLERAVEP